VAFNKRFAMSDTEVGIVSPGVSHYEYFLKHRQTGETISLGNDGVLKEEDRSRVLVSDHDEDWGIDWEFCVRKKP